MLVGSELEKIKGQLLISWGTLFSVTVWRNKWSELTSVGSENGGVWLLLQFGREHGQTAVPDGQTQQDFSKDDFGQTKVRLLRHPCSLPLLPWEVDQASPRSRCIHLGGGWRVCDTASRGEYFSEKPIFLHIPQKWPCTGIQVPPGTWTWVDSNISARSPKKAFFLHKVAIYLSARTPKKMLFLCAI